MNGTENTELLNSTFQDPATKSILR